MKILWICNIPLPIISRHMKQKELVIGGWLQGFYNEILKHKEINLYYAFPQNITPELIIDKVDILTYFGFNIKDIENSSKKILNQVNPDILHIFGTEDFHALLFSLNFNKPLKTIINVQGLVSIIGLHYYTGLPNRIINQRTLRDFIKNDSLKKQRNMYIEKGIIEKRSLLSVGNIIGRTTWDKAISTQINPDVHYYHCDEILRNKFYESEKWNINNCQRYSIFISQAMYPVKGLHFMLEALPLIIKKFPLTHLFIGGNEIRIVPKKRLDYYLQSSYARYLYTLIRRYKLESHITFLGVLEESSMIERLLTSHVFVSSSIIENESNSLSEAKLLGVPCVASYVGGVTDRINQGIDGFLYPHDEPYMLAYYINQVFSDEKLCDRLSSNSIIANTEINSREQNSTKLTKIYFDVFNRK